MAKISWIKVLFIASFFLNVGLSWFVINLLKFDSTRVDLYDYLANHFGKVEVVLTGDSLTRRNSDLAWKISGLALNVKNIARDGDNIHQVSDQVDKAIAFQPKIIVIMAGTNRVKGMSAEQTFLHYKQLINNVLEHGVKPILMAAPLTNRPELNEYLGRLNTLLFQFASENKLPFFATNNALDIEQELSKPYTVDGVHLTPQAYETLNEKLIPFIQHHLQTANNKN